ncbi:type II toxin-antitoxin system death-on-curing family toxin [Enterococcus lactis]|uniref:type II toxin-antitoxin system death-on-curing family toxin n=1 Tax=Enterococcus lactis TaxID=357441 RepID=UPI00241100D9|nr:type II toxin-antitoxin system death-on-curing family toxin [Enterococcus lactis]
MRYLSTKEIIKINAKVILRYSPGEMIGIKDANALDMAVKQPSQAVFNQELYPEVYEKAAILAINLAKKHPFHNGNKHGNKRTALVAMLLFLQLNNCSVAFSRQEAVDFIIMITTSSLDFDSLKSKITNYLRQTAIK